MQPLFYSTGQVARQLGTTLAAIRVLCENRVIAAETTPGGHLRVPASEVGRLKRDGLPPIPRPLPTERAPSASNGTAGRLGQPELTIQTRMAAEPFSVGFGSPVLPELPFRVNTPPLTNGSSSCDRDSNPEPDRKLHALG
jgi:hypothetical protein